MTLEEIVLREVTNPEQVLELSKNIQSSEKFQAMGYRLFLGIDADKEVHQLHDGEDNSSNAAYRNYFWLPKGSSQEIYLLDVGQFKNVIINLTSYLSGIAYLSFKAAGNGKQTEDRLTQDQRKKTGYTVTMINLLLTENIKMLDEGKIDKYGTTNGFDNSVIYKQLKKLKDKSWTLSRQVIGSDGFMTGVDEFKQTFYEIANGYFKIS